MHKCHFYAKTCTSNYIFYEIFRSSLELLSSTLGEKVNLQLLEERI